MPFQTLLVRPFAFSLRVALRALASIIYTRFREFNLLNGSLVACLPDFAPRAFPFFPPLGVGMPGAMHFTNWFVRNVLHWISTRIPGPRGCRTFFPLALSTLNLLFPHQNQQDINSKLTVGQRSKLQQGKERECWDIMKCRYAFNSPKTGGREKSICGPIEREKRRGGTFSWFCSFYSADYCVS